DLYITHILLLFFEYGDQVYGATTSQRSKQQLHGTHTLPGATDVGRGVNFDNVAMLISRLEVEWLIQSIEFYPDHLSCIVPATNSYQPPLLQYLPQLPAQVKATKCR